MRIGLPYILPLFVAVTTASAIAQDQDRADIASLLPDRTLLAVDGADSSAFAASAAALYGDVVATLDPPYRGLAALLAPAMKIGLGFSLEELADGALPGEWAFALVRVDGRVKPLLVIRPKDAADVVLADLRRVGGRLAAAEADGVIAITASRRDCDRYHEWRRSGRAALSDRPEYLAHRFDRGDDSTARVWLDVATLRGGASGRRALEQPFVALLARPILDAVGTSKRFDGRIGYDARRLSLRGRLDGTVMRAFGERLLAGGAAGYAIPPAPRDALASLYLDRSGTAFWRELDGLTDDAGRAQANGFLSIADQILGASFVDELLPSFGEPWTLFAIRSPIDEGAPTPGLALPSFAVVAPLRDPDVESLVSRAFSAFVFIANQERVQRGEITFDLRRRSAEDGESLYVAEARDWLGAEPPPLAAGFGFTFAFTADRVVFASTEAGARACLAGWRDVGRRRERTERFGDSIEIDPVRLAEFLRANRDVLTLNGVLEGGKSWRVQQREVDLALDVLDSLSDARFDWVPAEAGTDIRLTVEVVDV